jgi:competence protein ComFB
MDIANLALNHLPPKYISTEKGQVFARVECFNRQSEVEIVKQIAAAIEQVENHPRH